MTHAEFFSFVILLPGFCGVFMMWMHMLITITLPAEEVRGVPAMYWFFLYGFVMGMAGVAVGLMLRAYA